VAGVSGWSRFAERLGEVGLRRDGEVRVAGDPAGGATWCWAGRPGSASRTSLSDALERVLPDVVEVVLAVVGGGRDPVPSPPSV
jgi:hypothetical protein